ncbi:error-prone DNA polymerase [Aquabacterium sp.]|uniref:error-prone DNA polymerase n=1 Tax=Aquabacterium sp. TaxID=1872578 RepID=UPI0025C664F1|nr:error-prone DNA polymerase [Aquabacterium sp.]
MGLPDYAELHAASNFSFLQGASHAEELIQRALALGYRGLAITDDCTLAGVVRAHLALRDARESGLPGADTFQLLIGSQFLISPTQAEAQAGVPPAKLVALACHREGYASLCQFITALRRAEPGKGASPLHRHQLTSASLSGCVLIYLPDRAHARAALMRQKQEPGQNTPDTVWQPIHEQAAWLQGLFLGRLWLGVALHHHLDDAWWLHGLRGVGEANSLPLVASGDVLMHVRSRKPLQDVLTAVRLGQPVSECGLALERHAERHLRSRLRLSQRYPADLLAATLDVAARCHFSLDELRYEYPEEVVPRGSTPPLHLRHLTLAGLRVRYPQGAPWGVRKRIVHELRLIHEMAYEKYFLTVEDIVRFARSQGILCQGRGSAANSAVCYALGITEVNPQEATLLFERFISKERGEPPDIDVDFEHDRREEVIQYIYRKYGRDRTALTATVISYRTRSALRDVGKAMGFSLDETEQAARHLQWWDRSEHMAERLAEAGLDPSSRRVQIWLELTRVLIGFPRHLSQHTGGFVIAGGQLSRMVPIENASMPERSIIQWDKDDLEALGLMKVDVLALGMLSAIRRALHFVGQRRGQVFRMQDIPQEDADTYDMVCRADTIGVFQIESRAQMSMLPRLQPRTFYDLVVEVALVRPGPIQGGMVHPYLQRREALRADPNAPLPSPPRLGEALARTLGVPIFQEQVMQIAVLAAGFTPGQADQLRRAMASWRKKGEVDRFKARIVEGMRYRQYEDAFIEQICQQIEGFGSYGFPESHAASFAKLVYLSAWLKCHEPAAFLAALLNAQPLGFYSPSQLVQDARRHGVDVLPADVQHSAVDTHLVETEASAAWAQRPIQAATRPKDHRFSHATPPQPATPQPAVRLGLRLIAGLGHDALQRIVDARQQGGPFTNVDEFARRAGLSQAELRALASADTLESLAGHRRQQVWEAAALHKAPALLREVPVHEAPLQLEAPPEAEDITFDYAALGLSLRRHPLALLRPHLAAMRLKTSAELQGYRNGQLARACGIVTVRQQPGTASGVVFVTLEDETGTVNVVVWAHLKEKQRRELVHSRLMAVDGKWQRQGEVRHLIAERLHDLTPLLGRLATHSRDFH